MESLRSNIDYRRSAAGLVLSGIALSSCTAENVEIKANIPAEIIDKYVETNVSTTSEIDNQGRFESVYWVVLQQCNREDSTYADEHGCAVLKTDVSDKAYADYELSQPIVFMTDIPGYPLDDATTPPLSTLQG